MRRDQVLGTEEPEQEEAWKDERSTGTSKKVPLQWGNLYSADSHNPYLRVIPCQINWLQTSCQLHIPIFGLCEAFWLIINKKMGKKIEMGHMPKI